MLTRYSMIVSYIVIYRLLIPNSRNNFLMNPVAALAAYCFYDNKPEALQGVPLGTPNKWHCFNAISNSCRLCACFLHIDVANG